MLVKSGCELAPAATLPPHTRWSSLYRNIGLSFVRNVLHTFESKLRIARILPDRFELLYSAVHSHHRHEQIENTTTHVGQQLRPTQPISLINQVKVVKISVV